MLNLLTAQQTKAADQFTINKQEIASVKLMERAAEAFVSVFAKYYSDQKSAISVYCGTGNNGGDGLAIARLLSQRGYQQVNVKIARFSTNESDDFQINYTRLKSTNLPIVEITESDPFPVENAELIIDALLGTGLNKPLEGAWKEMVIWLKSLNRVVVSVDIPTGFKGEGQMGKKDIAIKADLTISFQRPKINFLLPESAAFLDQFEVADIGLDENFIQDQETPYYMLTKDDVRSRLIKRSQFSHKGTFGHTLIIAGAQETMGAALLCSEASLFAGSGLTTACIPAEGLIALNSRLPEVMAQIRVGGELPKELNWEKYSSIAIGPGLGTSAIGKAILEETLKSFNKPMVFDADALNLLAKNTDLLTLVQEGSVLTPHMKEFDRLFGEHQTWWDRLETGLEKAKELKCCIVLKNRYSIVFTPDGRCIFNPTGTPAMASGGMGDVLTGIIASFLSQGYSSENAAILGVFLHGKAGEDLGKPVVTASQVIHQLPKTIKTFI